MIKKSMAFTTVLAAIVAIFLCANTAYAQDRPGWRLVWNDEFDGTSLDTTKWDHEVDCWGGGNNELQCYTARPQNSYVRDGKLTLVAVQGQYTGTIGDCTNNNDNSCGNTKPYTSARLRTRRSATGAWKYGRIEMSAKLPKGKHLWPAFWMLPNDYVYGNWAASGEIDIMEYRGQEPTISSSALHYGGVWPNNRYITTGKVNYDFDFNAAFHVFAVEWEQYEMRFYVDNYLQWTVDLNRNWYGGAGPNPYTQNAQPWDQKMHILINLAIGGGFFGPEYGTLSAQDAANWADPTYQIDYVRVYEKDTGAQSTSTSSSGSTSTSSSGSGTSSSSSGAGVSSTSSDGSSTSSCYCPGTDQSEGSNNVGTNTDSATSPNGSVNNMFGSNPEGLTNFMVGAVMAVLALLVVAVVLLVFIAVKGNSFIRDNGMSSITMHRA